MLMRTSNIDSSSAYEFDTSIFESMRQITEQELGTRPDSIAVAPHSQSLAVRNETPTSVELDRLVGQLAAQNRTLGEEKMQLVTQIKALDAYTRQALSLIEKVRAERDALKKQLNENPFTVAILDFEQDVFSTKIFQKDNAASNAARKLLDWVWNTLSEDVAEKQPVVMIYIFFNRSKRLIKDLINDGAIETETDLDEFIRDFNLAYPLYTIFQTDSPKPAAMQRMRAYATVFARNPTCKRLVVGKWAADLEFINMIAPVKTDAEKPKKKEIPKIPEKIKFIEPYGPIKAELLDRGFEHNMVKFSGLFRSTPFPKSTNNSKLRHNWSIVRGPKNSDEDDDSD